MGILTLFYFLIKPTKRLDVETVSRPVSQNVPDFDFAFILYFCNSRATMT